MDVHAPRHVRCTCIIFPILEDELGVGFGDDYEVASSFVVEIIVPLGLPVENPAHAVEVAQECHDFLRYGGLVDVDVRELAVGDGERAAGVGAEELEV